MEIISKLYLSASLGLAADAAREGDFTKCAAYVENIASVFFPVSGSEDPLWPNAANNAFKRSAYGLIDYYLELEKEKRILADKENWSDKKLETELDLMWGQVTLYNCYQLFVQLSSKMLKNPTADFKARAEAGDFNELTEEEELDPDNLRPGREPMNEEEFAEAKVRVTHESQFWNQKPEEDVLTLFFNATMSLPQNSMRRLIGDADNSLRAINF